MRLRDPGALTSLLKTVSVLETPPGAFFPAFFRLSAHFFDFFRRAGLQNRKDVPY